MLVMITELCFHHAGYLYVYTVNVDGSSSKGATGIALTLQVTISRVVLKGELL